MFETIISPNEIYQLTLSEGYVLVETEQTQTIFNEEKGYGAINISSYKIPLDYVFDIENELRDFAISIDKNITNDSLQIMTSWYASSEFITMGTYWKIWTFFRNYNAVFASYNCDERDMRYEMDDVNNIMQSLKIL